MENFNPLIEFLRERNIDEATIARILEDKIDASVILLMSDDNLAKYIPHYGDRLAVLAFCRKQQSTDGNPDRKSHNGNTDRKSQLLERLRSKLCNPNPNPIEIKRSKISHKFIGNTNAKKKDRKVQLGWMMYNEKDKEFKQVRQSKGGGTRDEKVDRLTTVEELKVKAENLFFPDGKANLFKLKLKDVHCTVRDTSHRILDPECTVEDLYEAAKVKVLRLYLFTKPKHMEHSYIVDDEEPEIEAVPSVFQNETQQLMTFGILEEGSFDLENEDPRELMNQQLQYTQDMEMDHWQGTPMEPHKASEQGDNIQELTESINANRSLTNVRSHQTSERGGNIPELWGTNAHRNPIDVRQETLQGELLENNNAHSSPIDVSTSSHTDSGVITEAVFSEPQDLEDSIPDDAGLTVIVVRRGFVLTDLMNIFSDPAIMEKELSVRMKLPNGKLEPGHGSGVFRDCLCDFWKEFYSKCTLGTNVKVPFLRHEYQEHEWQTVARILVKGWLAVGYFPIKFSLPFLEEAFYGNTYSSVRDSFMHYISTGQRKILEQALDNFRSVEPDELFDVLDAHDCHQNPTEENLSALLSQLGHKALIQTPMFVVESWRPILSNLAKTLTPQRLADIMLERVPTPTRVGKILKFPQDMSAPQRRVARHLRRYIEEIDDHTLKHFLRFCTGADLLFGKDINVTFSETTDFQCRPTAHTCGCYLVVPVQYQNYPDLRSDFDTILNSSIWVMDIA